MARQQLGEPVLVVGGDLERPRCERGEDRARLPLEVLDAGHRAEPLHLFPVQESPVHYASEKKKLWHLLCQLEEGPDIIFRTKNKCIARPCKRQCRLELGARDGQAYSFIVVRLQEKVLFEQHVVYFSSLLHEHWVFMHEAYQLGFVQFVTEDVGSDSVVWVWLSFQVDSSSEGARLPERLRTSRYYGLARFEDRLLFKMWLPRVAPANSPIPDLSYQRARNSRARRAWPPDMGSRR